MLYFYFNVICSCWNAIIVCEMIDWLSNHYKSENLLQFWTWKLFHDSIDYFNSIFRMLFFFFYYLLSGLKPFIKLVSNKGGKETIATIFLFSISYQHQRNFDWFGDWSPFEKYWLQMILDKSETIEGKGDQRFCHSFIKWFFFRKSQ